MLEIVRLNLRNMMILFLVFLVIFVYFFIKFLTADGNYLIWLHLEFEFDMKRTLKFQYFVVRGFHVIVKRESETRRN